jgi:hypothetical protein
MHRPLLALTLFGMIVTWVYGVMNPWKMCCADCRVEMRLEERSAFGSCWNVSAYYLRMDDKVKAIEPADRSVTRCRVYCDSPSSFFPDNSCVPNDRANPLVLVVFFLGFPMMFHAGLDYPE